MRPTPRTWRTLAALLAVATLAACGGDDDDVADSADTGTESQQSTDCAATDVVFTNLETGTSGTATYAVAERVADGGLYTVYAADFDIGEDDLESWRPEVPDGNNAIAVQLTVYNAESAPEPLEPGTTLEATADPGVLTFVTRHFTAEEDWSEADLLSDGTRELTVTAVGDQICFDIDYTDQQKEISGTIAAPVLRG